ncbi:MAG: hypothetical protein QOC77_185 [Thermoleophilaceae bacterium]|jgi:hypothetical protein|nr:hypothetical protein [Thermoleophilaceae bacterium]MEA2469450.1 hypothetical protein [Thermoleophilaceae bacterium]
MRSTTAVAVVSLSAAFAVTACGDGKSDKQKVRDAVNGFDKALFEHRFEQSCGHLSDGLIRGAYHDMRGCVAKIPTHNPTTVDGQIKSVDVSGDRATVVAQGPVGAPVPLEVQKVRGAWKITGPLRNFKR